MLHWQWEVEQLIIRFRIRFKQTRSFDLWLFSSWSQIPKYIRSIDQMIFQTNKKKDYPIVILILATYYVMIKVYPSHAVLITIVE